MMNLVTELAVEEVQKINARLQRIGGELQVAKIVTEIILTRVEFEQGPRLGKVITTTFTNGMTEQVKQWYQDGRLVQTDFF